MNAYVIRRRNTGFGFLVFSVLIFLVSCARENIDVIDCAGITPTYTADIKPILNASCAISDCHDAITHEQGLNLGNYAGAREASLADRFLGAIQQKRGYQAMPQNASKLSDASIQLLTCWVQNGSPE